MLATTAADADVRLWDLASGREVHRFDNDVTHFGIAFSPRDGTFASGGADRRVTLRAASTWRQSGVFAVKAPRAILSIAWAPSGESMAVGTVDDASLGNGEVHLVRTATQDVIGSFDTAGQAPLGLAFLDGDTVVASMGIPGTELRAWSVKASR